MAKGNYNLKTLMINGTDFKKAFSQLIFYEDIFSNEMSGHIDVMETESVREYFSGLPNGIIGEEYLTLSFASKFPDGTEHETITKVFWINKLEDYTHLTLSQRSYRLHFISMYHLQNTSHRNRKIWEDKSSGIVSTIIEQQLSAPINQIDTTSFEREYIFPNWTPFQVANFLSTVSLSEEFNDPKYLFYECRDGFNFVSLSYLMNKSYSHEMTSKLFDGGVEDFNRFNIQTYTAKAFYDNSMNEYTGMYGNTLITYDKVNKKFEETTKTYTGTWGQFKHVGETKLTKSFSESPKNRFQFMSINKTENPGIYDKTNLYTRQLLNRSNQPKNNIFVVTYTGNTYLKVGNTIKFDMKTAKDPGKDPDKKLSGKYLMTRLKHIIDVEDYTTIVEIVKDGYLT